MRSVEAVLVAAVFSGPFVAYLLARPVAPAEGERAGRCVLKALLPPAAFLAMVAANVAIAILFSLQHVPERQARVPQTLAGCVGVGVVLLLALDNLRTANRANRALGALYLACGLVLGYLVTTAS